MIKKLILSLGAAALFAGCACDTCKSSSAPAPVKHSHGTGKDAKNY
jgi:hypothetical protein